MTLMRLHKFLSRAGVASVRKSEQLILDGRVLVNGEVVNTVGVSIDPDKDRVSIDGEDVVLSQPIYLVMNKPIGYITTLQDTHGRPTVADLLDGRVSNRVYPIGRLDQDTEGVLLLTNDGLLAQRLLHPSHMVEKVYRAEIEGAVIQQDMKRFERGIIDEGEMLYARDARIIEMDSAHNRSIVEFVLTQGRKREIRRLVARLGFNLLSLRRISFAGITVAGLKPGDVRDLTENEIAQLRRLTGMS